MSDDDACRLNVMCVECRYYVDCGSDSDSLGAVEYAEYMDGAAGECRRFPPMHGSLLPVGKKPTQDQIDWESHRFGVFTLVAPDWWCGEFAQKSTSGIKPAVGVSAIRKRRK